MSGKYTSPMDPMGLKGPSLKPKVCPQKWMVGILISFWDGLFSGAMLVSGRVNVRIHQNLRFAWPTLFLEHLYSSNSQLLPAGKLYMISKFELHRPRFNAGSLPENDCCLSYLELQMKSSKFTANHV